MSTSTDEAVDLDVDLDAPVPCAYPEDCNRTAVWVGTSTTPCPARHNMAVCDLHRKMIDERVMTLALDGTEIACSFCGDPWVPLDPPFVRWRPL